MIVSSSFSIKIDISKKTLKDTISVYRNALSFILHVLESEFINISNLNSKEQINTIENLIHNTKNNIATYDFDSKFYKYPSYLRRSTIMDAIGIYKSYNSNYQNWLIKKQGKLPKLQFKHIKFPCFLKPVMYEPMTKKHMVKIKIYKNKDWVWIPIKLNKSDQDFIKKHCYNLKESNPVLELVHKRYALRFTYEQNVTLTKKSNLICSVDLGINHSATCCIMKPNGTVLARKFIKCAREEDQLNHTLNKIKKHSKLGSKENKTLWAKVNNYNKEISILTTKAILDFAKVYQVDIIVFEYLDTQGKKKGSKKQRLSLWRKRDVQKRVEHNAHLNGMRVNRICAYNTSRLAFDGSGFVERDKSNYSICKFKTDKIYNCDLNAAYNIGARYYIKEKLKTFSEKKRLQMEAKVPSLCKRSTCTLATLKSILV